MSMMSGSVKHYRMSGGVPFIETNHLEPSSKLMAGMAADSTKGGPNYDEAYASRVTFAQRTTQAGT